MSSPFDSPSTLWALCSAIFSIIQAIPYLAVPETILTVLEPVSRGTEVSVLLLWTLRICGLMLFALAFPQYLLASSVFDDTDAEQFYTWTFSLLSQVLLVATSWVRLTSSRVLTPPLGADGSVLWSGLLVTSGSLAAWGIWCCLFVEGRGGKSQGKIRSSSWLFPTKEKRAAKAQRREKRYGIMANT